jgi:KipI family sensor histidine kinase inhibitor
VAAPRISRLGEHAWLVAYEPRLDVEINARVTALAARIRRQQWPGVRDIVPGAAALVVHLAPNADGTRIAEALMALATSTDPPALDRGAPVIEVPVCYGGEFGPDLPEVAQHTALPIDEVVRRHASTEYRVFMLGFLPGFPYLGVVDPALHVSRHAVPRAHVPAGSVGLAGQQTGIYPADSPGGWQIIGRTPLRLFDPAASPPALLRPGDHVRFVPVSARIFAAADSGVQRP